MFTAILNTRAKTTIAAALALIGAGAATPSQAFNFDSIQREAQRTVRQEVRSCPMVREVKSATNQALVRLFEEKPAVTLFYGFSLAGISTMEEAETMVIGMIGAGIACSIIFNTRDCGYVAEKIAVIAAVRGATCAVGGQMGCSC